MNDRETADGRSLGTGDDALPATPSPDDEVVLARFARPRTDMPTRIAVLSDPHVSTEKHGTWKLYHRTRERFDAALAAAEARDVDGIVLTGDLTEDGARADFEWVAERLDRAEVPVVAVPGNHDVPKAFDEHETPPLSTFMERYAPGGYPFVTRLGGVDVVGLNSASAADGSLDDTHDGRVSDDQLEWLDARLPETTDPLVVTHHNLPGLAADGDGDDAWLPHGPVGNGDALVGVLARHDVPLHLSGHIHVPALTETKGVRGLVAPALSSFPQASLVIEVDEAGTTVRYVPVGSEAEAAEAYRYAQEHSARSKAVSELTARRLDALPLADERVAATIPADD